MARVTITVDAHDATEEDLRNYLCGLFGLMVANSITPLGFEVHAADDGHRYRDAKSGEFTTASDNAERPESVIEENGDKR